jgi:hypothetical protein
MTWEQKQMSMFQKNPIIPSLSRKTWQQKRVLIEQPTQLILFKNCCPSPSFRNPAVPLSFPSPYYFWLYQVSAVPHHLPQEVQL